MICFRWLFSVFAVSAARILLRENKMGVLIMKTLYVTDLDGTLMRDDKTISDRSVEMINRLIQEGILITYATARSIYSASEITEKINFKIPVITRNGTALADGVTKKEIEIEVFQQEELLDIKKYVQKYKLPVFVTSYMDGREKMMYVTGRRNVGVEKFLDDHKKDERLYPVLSDNELWKGNVCYFTFIGDREELDPLYFDVSQDKRWNCVYQKDKYEPEYWLEISAKNATKAKAIKKIQDKYQCDRVVVFGDSLNDLSMFEEADEAYAVDNAMEEVKRMATGVIGSNHDDGVAVWIGRDVAIGL